MANDIQKKIQQKQGAKSTPPNPDRSKFTAEQRRMLGQVYALILSWQRECKTDMELSRKSISPIPVISVEVQA